MIFKHFFSVYTPISSKSVVYLIFMLFVNTNNFYITTTIEISMYFHNCFSKTISFGHVQSRQLRNLFRLNVDKLEQIY